MDNVTYNIMSVIPLKLFIGIQSCIDFFIEDDFTCYNLLLPFNNLMTWLMIEISERDEEGVLYIK